MLSYTELQKTHAQSDNAGEETQENGVFWRFSRRVR